MEARLAKMRIVGLRYDAARIETEDMQFDYTIPDSLPGHGANILRNGGGKGVYFQCLFQTLDPLTSWKGDSNQVAHFFFNADEQPIQYTFHIVQDWYLSLDKRVILGITVIPRLSTREMKNESSSPIELDFFTYVSEPGQNEALDIFDFPLWNEQEKEALPFDEWKNMLKADGHFSVYTKYQREEYLSKIEEFGYDANTVTILKNINVGEGSLERFFTGATDNQGLYYHLLVPALNDKIEGIDSRKEGVYSIVSHSFLDTLKIAKELPDLMAMVDSIEQINDHIYPLKDRFKEGEELKQNHELWQNKGKELNQLLSTMVETKEQQVVKLREEEESRQFDLQIAEWKLQNVDYIEIHQERDELDGQYFLMEEEQKKAEFAEKRLNKEHKQALINLELRRRGSVVEEVDTLKKSLQSLLESEDVKTANQGIQEIVAYFRENWTRIYANWEKEINRNHRSRKAHEQKIEELKNETKIERDKQQQMVLRIHDLTKEMEQFESKLASASSQYGVDLTYHIPETIEETQKERSETETIRNDAIVEQKRLTDELLSTRIEIAKQEQLLETLGEEIQRAQEQVTAVAAVEKEWIAEASNLLRTSLPQEQDRDGFYDIKKQLSQLLVNKRNEHQAEMRKMWTVQEDTLLIEEGEKIHAYIPNADLSKVKKALDAKKIECMYGTEYLHQLSKEEARRELEKNPALRYSIVILENAFESINFSFIQDELIRNHVVLVDKTQSSKKDKHITTNPFLSKQDEMNYLLKDRSSLFVEDEYEFEQWKASIESQLDNAEVQMELINKTIGRTEKALREIDILLKGKIRLEWEQEVVRLQSQKKSLEEAQTTRKETLQRIQQLLVQTDRNIESFNQLIQDLIKKEEELLQLKQEQDTYKGNKKLRTELVSLEAQLLFTIGELEKETESYVTQDANNQSSFQEWWKNTNLNFVSLKGMLEEIQLPVADEHQTIGEGDLRIHSYPRSLAKEDFHQLTTYRELQNSLSNKNVRVAEINARVDVLNEKITHMEQTLQQLAGVEWKTMESPTEDEVHLVSIVSQLAQSVKEAEKQVTSILERMNANQELMVSVEKRLQRKKDQIDEDYPQGAQYVELTDCQEARATYRKERDIIKQKSNAAKSEITKLSRSIDDIHTTTRLLESMGLATKSLVPETLTQEERVTIVLNPMDYYTKWTHENNTATNRFRVHQDHLRTRINQIKDTIESFTNIPLNYQRELVHFLSVIRDMSFEEAVNSLDNYLDWATHNLQDELEQKEKADKAIDLYCDRQARRIMDIINGLQDLVRKMTLINWKGERVRLAKFNKNYPFPFNHEDIKQSVKDFCLNEIEHYVKRYKERVNDLTVHDVAKTVNISKLTLKALGEFPKLMIHIPDIDGGLLRGEEKFLTYKDWETINIGSTRSSTKSGGQTLLAHFMILSMLMRQRVEDNSSLFIVSDNPFGTMSARELIEATFSLLELLNIQWIVVAPPIANTHITSKFPTIHNLKLQAVSGGQVLTKKLVKNYRKYLENISILDNPEDQTDIS
ncbi:hypothetical protein AA0X95_16535 [Bacillus sp. 1P10SD]|uniref:hypothetical protein n=1 Tax=Bacillus sp. 1P10SD TaxID=3132265 RepID=UPI0039A4D575